MAALRLHCCLAALLVGCASPSTAPLQQIEFRVDAEDPDWRGPLDCRAENSLGSWSFTAPGMVIVASASSPLQVHCEAPAGVTAPDFAAGAGSGRPAASEAGAQQGLGNGLGYAVQMSMSGGAAPVVAVLGLSLTLMGVSQAGANGNVYGAAGGSGIPRYPDTIVIRLRREPP